MVSEVEIQSLIQAARSCGVMILTRVDAIGGPVTAVQVRRGIGNCGKEWMPVVQAAEVLREFIASRNEAIEDCTEDTVKELVRTGDYLETSYEAEIKALRADNERLVLLLQADNDEVCEKLLLALSGIVATPADGYKHPIEAVRDVLELRRRFEQVVEESAERLCDKLDLATRVRELEERIDLARQIIDGTKPCDLGHCDVDCNGTLRGA